LKIGVLGLGYVGLPLACSFVKKKNYVVGFDSSKKRIDELILGNDINNEILEEKYLKSELLHFTNKLNELKSCDIYIITVPTPVKANKKPDLKPLAKASSYVGKVISKNNIVIYESTVYPGCTEEFCIPIIEKESKLIFNKDFFCGYSPERINPGDKKRKLEDIIKVTSGSNPEIAKKIDKLYKSIIKAGTYLAPSIKIAEASKIIENIQRDVNISLMNEFAIIFEKIGIDTEEVLNAARTKWNFLNFKPGLVGGHCIGVDPYYLSYKAESLNYKPKLILSGRKINDKMGKHISEVIFKLIKKNKLSTHKLETLILGITFKENCSDLRNSRVFDLFNELKKIGLNPDILDPYAERKLVEKKFKIKLIEKINIKYDIVILAVSHDQFKFIDLNKISKKNSIIYDIKSFFPKNKVSARL
jgi:UDP-N-acetyl-D-glucosamine/UDP-N-acetyl-D-galactosamine dehydrogenase